MSVSKSELLRVYRVTFFRSQRCKSSVISSSRKYVGCSDMFVCATCEVAPFMKALKSVELCRG